MDRNEAKLLLQACRPNGEDAASPVFAEALALAVRDPELKAWWEAQQAFDRKISAKLKEVPVPADLRATILAGRKIEQLTPHYRLPYWLAAAAIVMVLCVAGSLAFHTGQQRPPTMAKAGYDEAALAFLGNDAPSLGTLSADHGQVEAWLSQHNSPVGTIPANMGSMPSVGCQTFAVQGHTVSLICFSMAGGGVAHLFVVDQKALTDPPGMSGPEYKQFGSWATASWSDGTKSYLLATRAGPDMLQRLL